jgi:hypothetical protein
MKRILAATLFVLVACPLAGQTVSAGSPAARCGATVDVPVTVDEVAGMVAIELRLDYDASKLTAKSVVAGDLTRDFQVASNLKAEGLVRIAMAAGRAVSGSGAVMRVTFAVAPGATGDAAISLARVLVNDAEAKAAGGIVKIDCPSPPAKADPSP